MKATIATVFAAIALAGVTAYGIVSNEKPEPVRKPLVVYGTR